MHVNSDCACGVRSFAVSLVQAAVVHLSPLPIRLVVSIYYVSVGLGIAIR